MRNRLVGLAAVATLLLLCLPAWASHTDHATLWLSQPATIAGRTLAPGQYSLAAVPGSSRLAVYRNGRKIATPPCHWFQLTKKPYQTEVFLTRRQVRQVRFRGQLMAVRLAPAPTAKS